MNNMESNMWKEINSELLSSESPIDITNLRNKHSINNKLLTWDPYEHSTRHFKNFLYEIVRNADQSFYDVYSQISNTLIGNPITIKFNGTPYNLDYVASAFEMLAMHTTLKDTRTICEIGAGFGRTAHAILNVYGNVSTYTIVDLPPMIQLSREFLRVALPQDQYEKVVFVTTDEDFHKIKADLFINIDSFAEMDKTVVAMYLSLIARNSKFFYCKNPIGKYLPEMVGIDSIDKRKIDEVMQYGLCNEVVDIFDSTDMESKVDRYLRAYRPSNDFDVIKTYGSEVYAFYQHALYQKQCSQ